MPVVLAEDQVIETDPIVKIWARVKEFRPAEVLTALMAERN